MTTIDGPYNAKQVDLIEQAVKGFAAGMRAAAAMETAGMTHEGYQEAERRRDMFIEQGVRNTAQLAVLMMQGKK